MAFHVLLLHTRITSFLFFFIICFLVITALNPYKLCFFYWRTLKEFYFLWWKFLVQVIFRTMAMSIIRNEIYIVGYKIGLSTFFFFLSIYYFKPELKKTFNVNLIFRKKRFKKKGRTIVLFRGKCGQLLKANLYIFFLKKNLFVNSVDLLTN